MVNNTAPRGKQTTNEEGKTTSEKIIRPLTRQLYECLAWDVYPSNATCIDFGIKTAEHLGALQWAVSVDETSIDQLEEACGNGEKLNALISPTNPYYGVRFHTPWDELRLMTERLKS